MHENVVAGPDRPLEKPQKPHEKAIYQGQIAGRPTMGYGNP